MELYMVPSTWYEMNGDANKVGWILAGVICMYFVIKIEILFWQKISKAGAGVV